MSGSWSDEVEQRQEQEGLIWTTVGPSGKQLQQKAKKESIGPSKKPVPKPVTKQTSEHHAKIGCAVVWNKPGPVQAGGGGPARPSGEYWGARPKVLTKDSEHATWNDQLGQFTLVSELLLKAGLCRPDILACMGRYIRGVTGAQFKMLQLHLPEIKTLLNDSRTTSVWSETEPVTELISKMGNGLPVKYIERALERTKSLVLRNPGNFVGKEGWFLWLSHNLCARSSSTEVQGGKEDSKDNKDNKNRKTVKTFRFWLGDLENALYLGMISTLILEDKYDFSWHLMKAYKEAWYMFFGLFFNEKHFNEKCSCADKNELLFISSKNYRGDVGISDENEVAEIEKILLDTMRLDYDHAKMDEKNKITDLKALYSLSDGVLPRKLSRAVFCLHWGCNAELEEILDSHWTLREEHHEKEMERKAARIEKLKAKKAEGKAAKNDTTPSPEEAAPLKAAPAKDATLWITQKDFRGLSSRSANPQQKPSTNAL
ncbi:hypothetical protein B0H63DRAFT_455846 [Podospora didyma]|uniref:Uncharacterized protein n=1 Tax=Podospora didyma TaxID=330526 RepID=A0AAE0N1V1_9PEZI|nr:hypothetical protein B0H63DRAFT_455846 [Podospora didyma]